ncbi:MAG: sigma 54-interacting transcriptional regulator [Sandaracinaceae bacterium]
MGPQPEPENGTSSNQAFVAVRHDERSWVVDLPEGEAPFVGPSDGAVVRIEGFARAQGLVRWDGENLSLERTAKSPPIYVNGKRLQARAILKPGDELSVGDARMVVGVASHRDASGRRALTHHEFRERLGEELARAARRGRPTALVMVQAKSGDGGKVLETALASFRAGDVVATYAHDELELLFPDTSGDQTRAVVSRVLASAGLAGVWAGLAVAPHDADTAERLIRSARLALARARREKTAMIAGPPTRDEGISSAAPITLDEASQAVVERLTALAPAETPVLLTGEASSGKGVFARILHDESPRAQAPLVVLRCAGLVDQERIDEWLGPRGGIEDGATCRLLDARGGTLLLDEVSELPPDPQERLLDVLDALEGDVRLVATTHMDLVSLAERGAFSEALVEALQGEMVEIPALRERPDDIVPLAELFARQSGLEDVKLSPGALARLRSHPWPGNVLELRNAMERAVRLAGDGEIMAEHLPSDNLPVQQGEGRLREHVDSIERDAIVKALADANHNQTHAARRLGISRRALIYKMEKYGLKPPPGSSRK